MKIKCAKMSYWDVCALKRPARRKPKGQSMAFRLLLKAISSADLKAVDFSYRSIGMDRLGKAEPCLILMNHSSFIDLKIASTVLFPRRFSIVCTSDGFVGKDWLMRGLGCIPTNKFIFDPALVRDMAYAINTLKSSVLMYPEASYTFDGTATPLPASLGKCIKLLKAPVVMIRTYGAFARDPLYNGLRLRNVKVSADIEYLLSPDDISKMPADEINAILAERFSFDSFRWQQENGVRITEDFRATGLNRVLYKCPHCMAEGRMEGLGTRLVCHACGKSYELTELGYMEALEGETEFSHIPDWYAWERECVRRELMEGTYLLDIPVDIRMLVDTKCIYEVGEGRLIHTASGFRLTGCGGGLDYTQEPIASYSLYADYFWYELGDMVCIGDNNALYYCFPRDGKDIAAKTRLAAEELYKLKKQQGTFN